MKKRTKLTFILSTLLIFLLAAGSALADNHAADCVIPDSGPWPPCATGGEATDAWLNAGNNAGSSSGGGQMAANPGAPSVTIDLVSAMEELKFLLEQMGGLLDRLNDGSSESCDEYVSYYESIGALPVFENVPPAWQDLHQYYVDVAVNALESNKDIYRLCVDGGGTPSSLNYSIARTGINDALNDINTGLGAAAERADMPPPTASSQPPAAAPAAPPAPAPADEPAPPPPAQPAPVEEPAAPPPPPVEDPAPTAPVQQRPLPTEDEILAVGQRLYGEYEGPRSAARVELDIAEIDDEGVLNPPSVDFAPLDFVVASSVVAGSVNNMGGLIDRFLRGSAESCADYGGSFLTIALSPQFNNVPPAWQGMVNQYEAAIDKLLDTNKDFFLNACLVGGTFGEFNFWRARDGIDDARELINPVVEAAIEAYVEGR